MKKKTININVEFTNNERRLIIRDMQKHEEIEKEIVTYEVKILRLLKIKAIIEGKYSEMFK
jgi:hypothetical protein